MIMQNLIEGFTFGLTLSLVCFMTCGPIYTSYFLQQKSGWGESMANFLKLTSSRFLAYLLFGITAGMLGREVSSVNRSYFTIVSYTLCTIFLLVSAFWQTHKARGCQVSKWRRFAGSPFLLGLVTGVNFCPSFLITVTRAFDRSGALAGATLFIGFFISSNLLLSPLFLFGVLGKVKLLSSEITFFNSRIKFIRFVGVISAVVVSLFCSSLVYKEIVRLSGMHSLTRSNEEVDEKDIVTLLDSTDAFILCNDTASFTTLRDLFAEKRKGTVSLVSDTASLTSLCYVLIDPQWKNAPIDSIKKANRFVVVLSRPTIDGSFDHLYSSRLLAFLEKFYFKWDREHGSLFNMNKSQLITKQARS